jgi:acetyl-CoA carboxylase biotin carboxyl carrier protein
MAAQNIESETAGIVSRIEHREGQRVARDAAILFVEIMKMEIPVLSPADGTVVKLLVAQGDSVTEGQRVAVLETP